MIMVLAMLGSGFKIVPSIAPVAPPGSYPRVESLAVHRRINVEGMSANDGSAVLAQ